jgi:twitching motility two-component system response regulator PilG
LIQANFETQAPAKALEAEQPATANSSRPGEAFSHAGNPVSPQNVLIELNDEAQNQASSEEKEISLETAAFEKQNPAKDDKKPAPAEESAAATACPFCYVMNEPQAIACSSCRTMLSLSDLEMLLSHTEARPDVLEMAIEDLEAEKSSRGLDAAELTNLGIAHLNAKNLRKGLSCLQEVVLLTPNDVVLASKVNFLAIRVSEIEAHESKSEGAAQAKILTVMVVDDSPTVRKLISSKLEKCGHTVVCAADGMEALEHIKEVVPDLVLLDIMMPQMDGYQVCKMIRSNEPTKDVPVIMISGKDGFFDKVRGRMAGTSGFISKPFGPETLMKTIETYVG